MLPFTIGIEIEFNSFENDSYFHNVTFKRLGWTFATDSSCGYEIRSPILKTYDDITSGIKTVCRTMETGGVHIDDRCGLHIHVGLQGIKDFSAKYRLFRFCCHYEDVFFSFAPASRQDNRFCKRLDSDIRKIMADGQGWHAWRSHEDRYHWLNGWNMASLNINKMTVEFRLMMSTVDADYITGWIATLLCVVDAAHNTRKKVAWEKDRTSTVENFERDACITENVRHGDLAVLAKRWVSSNPSHVDFFPGASVNELVQFA